MDGAMSMKTQFVSLAIIVFLGVPQPALANMPPAPAQSMLAAVLIPFIMVILSLVGGGYAVLERLKRKESPSTIIIGVLGVIFVFIFLGIFGSVLVALFCGIIALKHGFQMIQWGWRARSSHERPEHLSEVNPRRLIPAGAFLIPITIFLMGMPVAFLDYWPAPRARLLIDFVAYQIAYADSEESKTGERRFHEITRDDPEFCEFFKLACSNIDIEYGADGKSFTIYLLPVRIFHFFPYNYLTSHPSFRADETGQIRMTYVHNGERCPPDAPVVTKVDDYTIKDYRMKIQSSLR